MSQYQSKICDRNRETRRMVFSMMPQILGRTPANIIVHGSSNDKNFTEDALAGLSGLKASGTAISVVEPTFQTLSAKSKQSQSNSKCYKKKNVAEKKFSL